MAMQTTTQKTPKIQILNEGFIKPYIFLFLGLKKIIIYSVIKVQRKHIVMQFGKTQ